MANGLPWQQLFVVARKPMMAMYILHDEVLDLMWFIEQRRAVALWLALEFQLIVHNNQLSSKLAHVLVTV